MFKHRRRLAQLLWITYTYSKRRQEAYQTAIRLAKLKKFSKGMAKIKEKVEYRRKLQRTNASENII